MLRVGLFVAALSIVGGLLAPNHAWTGVADSSTATLAAGGEGEGDGAQPDREHPGEIIHTDGILIADGRAMQLFTGSPSGSRHYARTLNEYADELTPKGVQVYSLIVPTAQTFYLPESYASRVRHEPPNIEATYSMLDSSIRSVDAVGALRGHANEYIYFRTDHHWTSLAAYYAYTAFCQAAGLKPISLDPANKRTISPYRGSLYKYTRESVGGKQADQIEYWVPKQSVSVERFGEDGKNAKATKLLHEGSKGYGVFLGGDQPMMVAKTTNNSGRRALLIKNSYGNPFAVYLVEHFDTVVMVDYRKFDGTVLELVDEHQITDVIVINGAITSNAKSHLASLDRLLDGKRKSSKQAAE